MFYVSHRLVESLPIATHSKLLNCNAKANNATVLKPKLGKLSTGAGLSFTYRNCVSVPKSKTE
eukprot:6416980-Amphidinium_carterae.1